MVILVFCRNQAGYCILGYEAYFMKLKNHGNFRSTKNFVLTWNSSFLNENGCFFLNRRHFFRRIRWSYSFFSKIKRNAIIRPRIPKIMIFRTSIFGIFDEIMAFRLIFEKNEYDHRILRKKWRRFKKKPVFVEIWPISGQNKILDFLTSYPKIQHPAWFL